MFLKTTALDKTITSGSTKFGEVIDVSNYSKLWIEMNCSGNIAGTGSLYITSISQADIEPNGISNAPAFYGQSPAKEISISGDPQSYASASILSIDAKWAVFSFTETSGSSTGTGSVFTKFSLQS